MMKNAPTTTTWKITCRSDDDARDLPQWLANRIALDRVLTDTVRTTPNGVEHTETIRHRLGDYFSAIQFGADTDRLAVRLVFERRPDAERFWKDLMVSIIQELEANPRVSAVEIDKTTVSAKAS